MPVISRAIPTLLRGISQSSDSLKQPDHADIQDNADSNPVLGLTKRSGFQYITALQSSTLGNVHIQTINRDTNERYVAIFSNGNIRVFELDGTELTVHKPDGTNYLNTSTPRSVIKTVSIADFTFVVNTSITAAMDTTLTSGTGTKAIVFINQATANTTYSITLNGVTVQDNTSGDSTLSTDTIAADLKTALEANSGINSSFTIVRNGPVLYIRRNDNLSFSIDGSDTQGDTKMTVVKDTIQRFSDLPVVAPHGYVVEVKGDEGTNFDNYYVKFVGNNTTTDGVLEEGQWEETVEAGITFKFNYDTMPHVLIRQADGNFRFARVDGDNYFAPDPITGSYSQSLNTVTITSNNHGLSTNDKAIIDFTPPNTTPSTAHPIDGEYTVTVINTNQFTVQRTELNSSGIPNGFTATGTYSYGLPANQYTLPKWGERTVGDLDSAPNPSFIGNKINNVFFFRNRLGFLAGDNVILSRVSEFFNFFPETVLSVLDNEPIDVAASHTKVAILRNAVTMGEKLILFSEQTQFVLTSSADNLTPKTANVIVATEFESSAAAQPVGSGSSIYFLTQKGSFAGIREYILAGESQIRDAANVTIHVPRLIPSNVFKMAVSTNQDILVVLGTDNPNKLFVYRWLYGADGNKALSSWFTFTINSNRSILNVDFIGTDLFVVIEEANKVTLEKIPFETEFREPNASFEYHLDHKVTEATTGVSVSYSSSTGLSTFTVPYRLRANMNLIGRYLGSGETSTFVDAEGNTQNLISGQVIKTTNATNGSTSTITATGDFRNSKFIIGEPYEMHYRFSKQRLTEQGAGSPEYVAGRLQLHHFYIKYEDAGFFKVEVTPENRDTSVHKFTGRLTGSASATIGQINLDTGRFKVPIMSKSDRVDIDIKNNTFLPTRLASAEYEGVFHIRSRRL
tara:strand:+ start:633 stop:3362 length:2730 start_codon:yes stop_codon:yes gene_type:complete